jgi:hypothetical protein
MSLRHPEFAMTTDLSTRDLFSADLAAIVHPCVGHPAPTPSLTNHQQIGFELGWDHAHHGITPPAPYAQEPSPLRNGWLAGIATFGARTLTPTGAVRQWLQLRLHAWLRGRSVELFQVTPHHLRQLATSHCPITREALDRPADNACAASFARVRHDAAYAAGNLALISAQAHAAKAAHGFESAMAIARRLDAEKARGNTAALHHEGLTAAPWARIAVLCSYVEPLPHARACELPLLVLPPNRLRLFNPGQALQAFISQQLLSSGWSQRINAIEALLRGPATRRAFRSFFQTLLPRVLAAGRPTDPQRARWAIEDAWGHAAVMQRWVRFASLLSASQCESLVRRAVADGLVPDGLRLEPLADAEATEGWCLQTRGYVPHGLVSPDWREQRARATAPVGQTLH